MEYSIRGRYTVPPPLDCRNRFPKDENARLRQVYGLLRPRACFGSTGFSLLFFFTFLFLHLLYAVCILLFFICNVGMLFCLRVGKGGVLKRSVLYAGVFRMTFDFKYVFGDP